MKKNCWEFKSCGRSPGGKHEETLGICPATVDERLNGVHDGLNAGRACWVVAGTFCEGTVQGTFAQKYDGCKDCEFYKTIIAEEGGNYMVGIAILNKIKYL